MDYYNWIKAVHVIAVFAWIAGMLYLPRLYVYHVPAAKGSELSETLKIMERRLLRAIINPAMITAWIAGVWMVCLNTALLHMPFFHAKIAFVIGLQIVHAMLARYRRTFANDANIHSAKFFRILNEVPTVLLIGIVIMIIVRPI